MVIRHERTINTMTDRVSFVSMMRSEESTKMQIKTLQRLCHEGDHLAQKFDLGKDWSPTKRSRRSWCSCSRAQHVKPSHEQAAQALAQHQVETWDKLKECYRPNTDDEKPTSHGRKLSKMLFSVCFLKIHKPTSLPSTLGNQPLTHYFISRSLIWTKLLLRTKPTSQTTASWETTDTASHEHNPTQGRF